MTDTIGLMDATVDRSNDVAIAAKLFCGFGDRTRLAILRLLADGERRVTDIVEALEASQANVSGHLKCLRECGLVVDRRSGREAYYRIAHSEVVDLLRSAEQLLAVTGTGIELCSNYKPHDEAPS
jgi:DNA-binding transcriptional ArsR family regulator